MKTNPTPRDWNRINPRKVGKGASAELAGFKRIYQKMQSNQPKPNNVREGVML